MLARIRALIDRWQQLKTVDALTDRDLADLGMTRRQVEDFIRMPPDVPDRVARMAAIFGLSEAEVKANHAEYLEILGTCAHCRERGTCSLILARWEIARPAEATFCPNAGTYSNHNHAAA
ncbi:DUF1127 domain-containing protein [Fuscovulum ytuae]|jgi:hypothetical protein|uniref:DUF1127 domain-containing protein n=1 Tax=Fuscovulum ytuae TaxID=3042299 RepID=A0ABY8Q656_9RHOB|nr:DUF1127 domain-containing protein [Fuscovulum sp. YMD61]WGV16128.1 DUF1127 domain-containing protein [Fuscovulum sp. YMD61]